MKGGFIAMAVAAALATASVTHASVREGGIAANSDAQLLVVGPVEAVDSQHRLVVVLGQKVNLPPDASPTVGDTVAVLGHVGADGVIDASRVDVEGQYVPGATPVLVSGIVQRANASVGQAVVSGLNVDLTGLMSGGAVSPSVGSTVAVSGTQPVNGGLLLASGITAGGALTRGITAGGALTRGITAGGALTRGITAGGALTRGITAGGALTR